MLYHVANYYRSRKRIEKDENGDDKVVGYRETISVERWERPKEKPHYSVSFHEKINNMSGCWQIVADDSLKEFPSHEECFTLLDEWKEKQHYCDVCGRVGHDEQCREIK